jgi:hypothetical protein
VAAAIRDRVQNERAVCCAPEPTARTTPGAGVEPVADAFAIPLAMSPADAAASTNVVVVIRLT